MSTQSKDITIGSGRIYVYPYSGYIPEDTTIEADDYILGFVVDGATVNYKPTYKGISNNEGVIKQSVPVSEEVTLKFGVINWDSTIFDTICSTSVSSTDDTTEEIITSLGGIQNANIKKYIVRFVHLDGIHRITIIGSNRDGFDISYQMRSASVVSATFRAFPMSNGSLIQYREGAQEVPSASGWATSGNVLYGKKFKNNAGTELTGSARLYVVDHCIHTPAGLIE